MRELFENHKGKSVDKWSSYLNEYENILKPYLNRPVNILEIGVANGGSLDVWAEVFTEGKIVGVDIDPKCGDLKYDNPRISVVVGDINEIDTKIKVIDQCGSYDIIIDDGSHITRDVIKTFAMYYPLLGNNSIYVIEDLHTSYWQDFGGGLRLPLTSMAFIKQLTDLPNFEHWRLGISRREFLKYYESFYEIQFDEGELATIHSVRITNSMAVIERRSSERNSLGKRVVRGEEESVTESAFLSDNTLISFIPARTQNDWQYEPVEMAMRINQLSKEAQ